ncbi:MAG: HD domain-containing protein [Elusimicrobiota bacterium]
MGPGRARLNGEIRGALRQARAAAAQQVWLVGGAPRDALLGRPILDLDLACADARILAARLARSFRGTLVVLDEANSVYRIALPPKPGKTLRQIDVAGLQGKTILEDLGRRDFTINALAFELGKTIPASIASTSFLDPRKGLGDLAAGLVRADVEDNLTDDPLRLLRAVRLAAQLGFDIEAGTLKAIYRHRRRVREPAPERIHAELFSLLGVSGSSRWIRLLDECGLLTEIFEELEPSRRCAENYYGPGGVMTHSLNVCARLDYLLDNLGAVFPSSGRDLEKHIASRGGPAFRALLLLSALLHDVSKPETARRVDDRLRFFEHDTRGAAVTEKILRRLRLSREHIETASAIVRHHLRPGHLASGGPLSERAVYRFFRDLGQNAPGLLLVCWADHASYMPHERLQRLLKTACADYGRSDLSRFKPEDTRKTLRHLQLVAQLLRRWQELEATPTPKQLVDGRDVMKRLKIPPGPKVGDILERVREAQAEGSIRSREDALALISLLK